MCVILLRSNATGSMRWIAEIRTVCSTYCLIASKHDSSRPCHQAQHMLNILKHDLFSIRFRTFSKPSALGHNGSGSLYDGSFEHVRATCLIKNNVRNPDQNPTWIYLFNQLWPKVCEQRQCGQRAKSSDPPQGFSRQDKIPERQTVSSQFETKCSTNMAFLANVTQHPLTNAPCPTRVRRDLCTAAVFTARVIRRHFPKKVFPACTT